METATEVTDLKSSVKILVVDDEMVFREEMARYLGGQGYDAATAGDGDASIAAAADFQPDVVLMDIIMPGGTDGIDAAVAIQRVCPEARLFFVSSYWNLPTYQSRAERSGLVISGWIDRSIGGGAILEKLVEAGLGELNAEEEIDFLYDEIYSLMAEGLSGPSVHGEVESLLDRLEILQEREAQKLTALLRQKRYLRSGEGWAARDWVERLLKK